MYGAFQLADVAVWLVHFVTLSKVVLQLAAADSGSAICITVVGCACVIALGAATIAVELVKVKVRQYSRKCELESPKTEPLNLETKSGKVGDHGRS